MVEDKNLLKPQVKLLRVWNHRLRSPGTIRLDLNESPYPPSPKVIRAAINAIFEANRYPINAEIELKARIADYVNVNQSNIVIGNGSDCLIHAIMDALIGEGDKVVMFKPSFQVYASAATRNGGIIKYIYLRPPNFKVKPEIVLERAKDSKVLVIINPNNPTGNIVFDKQDIEEILSNFTGIVVVDEAYYEFTGLTVADMIVDFKNLIVLRTFSKAFCMAGFRIGYAVTHTKMAEALMKVRQEFPVSGISLKAAIAALEDLDYMKHVVSKIIEERERIYSRLLNIKNVRPYPSCTNFILFKTSKGDVSSKLAEKGILIRDFSHDIGSYHFRVTIGLHEENDIFLQELEEILKVN